MVEMSYSHGASLSLAEEDSKFYSRRAHTNAVRLRISHGGNLVHYTCKIYANGKVEEMNWKCDMDFMSYIKTFKDINKLGYVRIKYMWYHDPKFSFKCELRPLNNDTYVLKFGEDMNGHDVSNIYVKHIIDEPIVITEDEVGEYVEFVHDPIQIDSDDEVHVEEKGVVHFEEREEVHVERGEKVHV
ncbi:hypothetical protein KIW84_015576 [Lathyrus oleraceus]|uniref:PB1-like domain-containing protein n=1 Tax=Pisum sativum TaxID=3888 RepID=A0A9D5H0R4_PEA|nr:hypothetical protein KIW84_015576 [Pisum sativum]